MTWGDAPPILRRMPEDEQRRPVRRDSPDRVGRKSPALWTALFISLGLLYRAYLTYVLPVGYDEVKVIAVGLEEMGESAGKALIEVPIRRSSGMTPLWWWIEYACTWGGQAISLLTLRIAPQVLGVMTLLVGYRVCAARWGRGTAVVFTGFLALSDILTFTHSRSDFSESLIVLLLVPLVCMVGRSDRWLLRGLLWLGLLMTGLGKGVFVIGLMLIAEFVVLALDRDRGRSAASLAGSLAIAAVPTAGYLAVASWYFADRESIAHDAVQASGVLELAYQLTVNYAETKGHVSGGWSDAALIWWDWYAWPVSVASGLVIAAALVFAVVRWSRRRTMFRSPRQAAMLGLLAWSLVGAAVVISRGTAGARFHLTYLPALWLFVAMALRSRIDRAGARTIVAVVIAGWLACVSIAGPLSWASFARFEPMHGQDELAQLNDWRRAGRPKPPPHGRTLYIDLAHHYLTIDRRSEADVDRAIGYAERETRRTPEAARAWFYLGDALHERGGRTPEACAAWRTGLGIEPHPAVARKVTEFCDESNVRR